MLPPFTSYDYQLIPLDIVLGHIFGTMDAPATEQVTNALDAGFRWVREIEVPDEGGALYAVFEQTAQHAAPKSPAQTGDPQ